MHKFVARGRNTGVAADKFSSMCVQVVYTRFTPPEVNTVLASSVRAGAAGQIRMYRTLHRSSVTWPGRIASVCMPFQTPHLLQIAIHYIRLPPRSISYHDERAAAEPCK